VCAQSAVKTDLPEPSADERALSQALSERLRAKIAQGGGVLAFDQYMECVLYEPALGYYVAGQRRFGPAGDFVTAPELTPLFGQCLAKQMAQWFEHCPPVIWEFGAGSGELAVQLVRAIAAAGRADLRYRIVELSPDLRERQRTRLRRSLPPTLHDRIEWLDALPDRIEGVVLGNELLDAMPVRRFEITEEGVAE
jgi:SAM-dependent MidA family methyltransferase